MCIWPLTNALFCWLLVAGMVTTVGAAQPTGRQHLVDPGDEWSRLAEQLRPGDEIILMPGEHRPAVLNDLRGLPEQPIVIRSLDTEHLATINAPGAAPGTTGGRYGLQLRRVQHVVIRDLIISGATVHGIDARGIESDDVGGNGPDRSSARGAEAGTHNRRGQQGASEIIISNVTIKRTGPIGRRNAITLTAFDGVSINKSTFEGWGGSGIELVACNNVDIRQCSFRGLPEYSQMNAVQVRAGTSGARISGCEMIDAGVTAVALGGKSTVEDFREQPTADSSVHEAARIRVTGNLIRGGFSAVAFVNCDRCVVRNNTIVRPRRWVYMLLDRGGEKVPHLALSQSSLFAANLIQWEPGDLQRLTYVRNSDRNEDAASDFKWLSLEQNLWWSRDLNATANRLGKPAGSSELPQRMDVDPKLDEQFYPTEPRAMMFGRDTP